MTAQNQTVVVRNLTIGAGMPKIIVPLVGKMPADLMKQAQRARKEPGVDAVEWRVDFYEHAFWPAQILAALKALRAVLGEIPLLFTFRTLQEGGEVEIGREEYYAINLAAARSGLVDLVDVEIDAGDDVSDHIAALHACGVKVVGSKHDFDATPADEVMCACLERAWGVGADLPKLAVMPRSEEDVRRLMAVTKALHEKHAGPLVTMSMGELGGISRVEGEKFGSAMTFGALGQTSAPGQIPVSRLRSELERIHAEIS